MLHVKVIGNVISLFGVKLCDSKLLSVCPSINNPLTNVHKPSLFELLLLLQLNLTVQNIHKRSKLRKRISWGVITAILQDLFCFFEHCIKLYLLLNSLRLLLLHFLLFLLLGVLLHLHLSRNLHFFWHFCQHLLPSQRNPLSLEFYLQKTVADPAHLAFEDSIAERIS